MDKWINKQLDNTDICQYKSFFFFQYQLIISYPYRPKFFIAIEQDRERERGRVCVRSVWMAISPCWHSLHLPLSRAERHSEREREGEERRRGGRARGSAGVMEKERERSRSPWCHLCWAERDDGIGRDTKTLCPLSHIHTHSHLSPLCSISFLLAHTRTE